jgi:hypothetical protein
MAIFFDLDGVIRNLCGLHCDKTKSWDTKIKGLGVCEYVNQDLEKILKSKPTPYFDVINRLQEITIISQQPNHWRSWSDKWIEKYFGNKKVTIIYTSECGDYKLNFLKSDDILIEDYPFFSSYKQVILIDYPYNRNVTCSDFMRINNPEQLSRFMEKYYFHRGLPKGGFKI